MKKFYLLKTFLLACIFSVVGISNAVAQAALPVSFDDGKSSLPTGFTANGLGSDYKSSPYLKFDNSGDNLILYFDGTPGVLSYNFKLNGTVNNDNIFTVETSVDGVTYTILKEYVGSEIATSISTASFPLSSDVRYIKWTYTNKASGNVALGAISLTEAEGEVATPTITPETETVFEESLDITIASEDGATVWYTIDGSEPTNAAPSIEYTAPFTIDATTTVKAIAVKDSKISNVATATYTKIVYLNGLSALVAKIKEDNSSSNVEYYVNLTGAVVTGVNGNNAYLEEGETGILLYKSNHGLTVGQKYSGTATVTAMMYNGNTPEITSLTCTNVETVEDLPLTTVTLAELESNYDTYLSRRVQIVDAVVSSAFESKNGEIEQDGKTIVVRAANTDITMAINDEVDVIGYPGLYSTTKQLNVLTQDDITVKTVAKIFSFSDEAVTVSLDKIDSFVAPTLENTYDEEPVYSSSNTDVATVNETTGEVTIVGKGTTTITATLSNAGKEVSYILTITTPVAYYLVTSDDELEAGARYLLVANSKEAAMGAQSGTYRSKVSVTISDNMIATAGDAEVITLEGTAGAWNFKVSGGYLYWDSGNSVKTGDTYDWAISIDEENNANITSVTASDRKLRYNASSPRFACYTSNQTAVQLYREYEVGKFNITTPEGYSTFFTDKAFVMPAGVEGSLVTGAADGKLTLGWEYQEGATVPANTALLVKGIQGEYTYAVTSTTDVAPTENMLKGSIVDAETEGNAGDKFYKLSYNNDGKLGFFWGGDNGAAFENKAGKAYLVIPQALASKVAGFVLDDNEVTAITSVESEKTNGAIYNMQGVRVNNTNLKGIYIINGKKVVVK